MNNKLVSGLKGIFLAASLCTTVVCGVRTWHAEQNDFLTQYRYKTGPKVETAHDTATREKAMFGTALMLALVSSIWAMPKSSGRGFGPPRMP